MTHGASQATALNITTCLQRWRDGESDALPELTDLVYRELRRLAAVFLRGEASGHTLQPTALVHELYLRIEGVREVDWKCRAQFFAISARMMRNILVDHARKRRAAKRGSGNVLPLSDCDFQSGGDTDVLLVDMALSRFAAKYPRQAQVVELRFFGGLTSEDTAEAMKIHFENTSLRTVERDWRFARAWLLNEIRSA
jgi:RNA polymerase sigma-70 factor, ECF subfamily